MQTGIELFFGSLTSTAGGLFKSLQLVNIPSIEDAKKQVNEFINKENIEVISISQQYNDGLLSIMVYYKSRN